MEQNKAGYLVLEGKMFAEAMAAADEGQIIRRTAWPSDLHVYGIHSLEGIYLYCKFGSGNAGTWTPTAGDMNATDWEVHEALPFMLKHHATATFTEEHAKGWVILLGRNGVQPTLTENPDVTVKEAFSEPKAIYRWIDWGLSFFEAYQLVMDGVRIFRSSWQNSNFVSFDLNSSRFWFHWGVDAAKEEKFAFQTHDMHATDWGVVVQEPEHKIAMSFSEAVDALRCGQSITRTIWRGGYRIRLMESGKVGSFSGTDDCTCDDCDEKTFKLTAQHVLATDWVVYLENPGELQEANQSTVHKGPLCSLEDSKVCKEAPERKPEDVEGVIAAGINHLSAHLVFDESYKDNLLGGRLCFRDYNTVFDKMPELEPLDVTLAVPKALKLNPELITRPGEGGEDAYLSLFVAGHLLDDYTLEREWKDLVCQKAIKLLQEQTLRFAEPEEKIDTKIKVKVFIPSILLRKPDVTAFHLGAIVAIRALHQALEHCPNFIKAWAVADMERHFHKQNTEHTLTEALGRWEWLKTVTDQLRGTWLQKVHVLREDEFARLKDLEHLQEVSLKNFEATGTRTETGDRVLSTGLNAILENALELARQDWIREGKPLKGPVDITVASDAYVELGAPWLAHVSAHARFLTAIDVIENGGIVRKFRFQWVEPVRALTADINKAAD